MAKDKKYDIEACIEEIQPEIEYCYNCQPRDSGETIWIQGIECDLEDLFNDYEVPDEIRDEVADGLVCKFCGTQMEREVC